MIKAILYLGVTLLLGAGFFARWIVRELLADAIRRRLHLGAWLGAVLLLGGSALDAIGALSRALGATDLALLPVFLAQTRQGNAVVVRAVATCALLLMTCRRVPFSSADKAAHGVLSLILLASFTLTSHAAGQNAALPIVADLVHMVAMAAWAGTIIYLAWLPLRTKAKREQAYVTDAVRRASTVGFAAVLALAATGLYASWVHLWGPAALAGTSYGRFLLSKLGIVVVIFAVAGINRWVLVPMVDRRGGLAALLRSVRLESVLLLLVLGVTGFLTAQPLPEAPATLADVISFREVAGPWIVRGSLSPRGAEGFALEMSMLDERGGPPPSAVSAQITLVMQDHDMSPIEVRAIPIGRGAYRADVPLPMAGNWQMVIRVPGGTVRVPVAARATAGVTTTIDWARGSGGAGAVAAGMLLGVYALRRAAKTTQTAAVLVGMGTALVILGGALVVWAIVPTSSAASLLDRQNPVRPTPASIAAGESIYRQHCQSCHGVVGAGDGPLAASLRPRPSDLRMHMAAGHSDGQLFYWITEGFKGTAMPAFKGTLSEEDRWNVLNFIRTFALTDR